MPSRQPRALRTLSALYFFSYGPYGIVFPIFPLLLKARGLSPTEISIVVVMNPLLNLITPPLWSALADALHARVAFLRITFFACALCVLLLFPSWHVVGASFAMAIFCAFRSPTVPLIDAATHAELGERVTDYAKVRVWGSIAFAICAGLAGLLDQLEHAEVVILIASFTFLIAGVVSLRLHAPPMHREPAVVKNTLAFISSAGLWPIFFANAFYYAAHSVFDIHYSLFLNALGCRDLLGPSWMLAVSSEVTVMFLAPKLLAARSPKNVIVVCAAVATLRWLLLAYVRDRSMILAIEALHGVTFGAWYLSLCRHVQAHAPDELRSSVQAALSTSMGIGTAFGYLFGGVLFEHFGGARLWQATALSAAVSLVIYAVASRRPSGPLSHTTSGA